MTTHGTVLANTTVDGKELYAIAVEIRNTDGTWTPEIVKMHATSPAHARTQYWLGISWPEHSRHRIVAIGLAVGGYAHDANADSVGY